MISDCLENILIKYQYEETSISFLADTNISTKNLDCFSSEQGKLVYCEDLSSACVEIDVSKIESTISDNVNVKPLFSEIEFEMPAWGDHMILKPLILEKSSVDDDNQTTINSPSDLS